MIISTVYVNMIEYVCSFGGYHRQLDCAANHEHVDSLFICFNITNPLRSFYLGIHSFTPSFCKLDVWSIAQWPHRWPQRQGRKRVRWSMRQQNPRRRALLQSGAMDVLLPEKNRTRVCGCLRCAPQTQKPCGKPKNKFKNTWQQDNTQKPKSAPPNCA